MPISSYEKVKVNDVEVDFVALKVLIDGQWLDIEARQLNLLKLLIDNHGKAVSRNQIMDDLWQETIVSDNSVSQAVTQLRRALGDDKGTPRFIKTVPRVGYQLIAELEFPTLTDPQLRAVHRHKKRTIYIAVSSAFIAIAATLSFIKLSEPPLKAPKYQYESRLTSTPGPESFLRYSSDGRYLAFSQISEDRRHMDLAVYDSQTQSVHTIKNTGYSEEAPEWSPSGDWLVYFRHDPFSCEIRYMAVKNPIETWRISPDKHLAYCNAGYSRQKLHWLNDNSVYYQSWDNNEPALTQLKLAVEKTIQVEETTVIPRVKPLLFDIDKSTKQTLMVQKFDNQFQLSLLDLETMDSKPIESREQEYWGLKWHDTGHSFWLGNESLRLMSLDGFSETIHLPMGYIPDLDLNPITKQLAHAEGVVNVNLYTANVNVAQQKTLDPKRLSSAARTDILPTIANNGTQIAFISYQRRSTDGLRHAEIWLKNKYKKAATLLVNLPENIKPNYLLWSPNGENLLLGDSQYKLHLINVFSKHMVPIMSNYQNIDQVNWSDDGKHLSFVTESSNTTQLWQYDLQLSTTELISEEPVDDSRSLINLDVAKLKKLNPSYRQFTFLVAQYLTAQIYNELPVENLIPSFSLYRPFVFEQGIYYVIKQGHQLSLYLYRFDNQQNTFVTTLGNIEQDVNLLLNISASADGQQVVYSKLEGLETDISVQKAVTEN